MNRDYDNGARMVAARDPFSRESIGYLLGSSALPTAATLASLSAGFKVARVIARLESKHATAHPPSPWAVDSIWIAKGGEEPDQSLPKGLSMSESSTLKDDEVLLMLARAAVSGSRDEVGIDKSLARIRNMAEIGTLASAKSFIIRHDDTVVAHVTYLPESEDPVTKETFTELVDTYVVEAWTGHGLGTLLSNKVLSTAAHKSQRVLGHVGWQDGQGARIMESLTRTGWIQVFTLYSASMGSENRSSESKVSPGLITRSK